LGPALSNLGTVLQGLGRLDEAQNALQRAVRLEPGRAEYLHNVGSILCDRGRAAEAIGWFDKALQAQPDFALARAMRGTARLSLGQFAAGWDDYESRILCPQFTMLRPPQPAWDGTPLAEGTLLVHAEQGFGDALQFVRYLCRCSGIVSPA
jgi:tetratricopeptide (TPR) repeat protein